MNGKWSTINRFGKRGPLRGVWLKDPDGNTVCIVLDAAIGGQIAAAMNLTTIGERVNYCAEQAGYCLASLTEKSHRSLTARKKNKREPA